MSSRCSTCSLTLGMVHQYHFSQSLRFIAVSHSGFNLHFCIIIDADHLLCTYWPFYISCFCSFLIVLSFFLMSGQNFSHLFQIFPLFSLLPSIPLNPSFSPIKPLSVPLSLPHSQSHPLFPPLFLLFLHFLHSCSPFPSKTPQNLRLWPPLLFYIRKNSITSPPISVLAWYHVPNRRKYTLSRKA